MQDEIEPATTEPVRPGGRPLRLLVAALAALTTGAVAVALTTGARRAGPSHAPPAAVLHLATGTAGVTEPAVYPVRPTEWHLGVTPPDLGAAAPLFRLSTVTVDERRVEQIATVLDVHGPVQHDGALWSVSAANGRRAGVNCDPAACRLDASLDGPRLVAGGSGSRGGSAPGSVTAPPATAPLPPPHLPTDEDALTTARSLLGRLDVLGHASWQWEVGPGMQSVVSCAVDAECPSEPAMWSKAVRVTQVVGRTPATAPSWVVEIGDGGRVDAVDGRFGVFEPTGELPIITTREAADDLLAGRVFGAGVRPATAPEPEPTVAVPVEPIVATADRVTLERTELPARLDDGTPATFLVPVYVFTDTAEHLSASVLALRRDAVRFDLQPVPAPLRVLRPDMRAAPVP